MTKHFFTHLQLRQLCACKHVAFRKYCQHTGTYMHLYTYTNLYALTHTYIHTYVHTYLHTYTLWKEQKIYDITQPLLQQCYQTLHLNAPTFNSKSPAYMFTNASALALFIDCMSLDGISLKTHENWIINIRYANAGHTYFTVSHPVLSSFSL